MQIDFDTRDARRTIGAIKRMPESMKGHILAALAGCGVDNAVVELDASEPPIGDGSARPYVRLIEKAGLMPQPESREYYEPSGPIEVVLGDSTMVVRFKPCACPRRYH